MTHDTSSVSRALKFTVWGMGVVLLGGMLFLASAVMSGTSGPKTSHCTLDAQHELPPHSEKNITVINEKMALITLNQPSHTTLITMNLCSGVINSQITLNHTHSEQ